MAKYKIDDNLELEAKTFMKDVINKLKEDGKIDESWNAGLYLMANNYSTVIKCDKQLATENLIVLGNNGAPTANPLIKVKNDAQIQLQKCLIEFLLTKKSVVKLPEAAPETEKTGLESFFESKNKIEKR